MKRVLTFDVGGTNIKYGLFEQSGHLCKLGQIPTQAIRGTEHILDAVCSIVHKHDRLCAVGISTSGQVSVKDGSILFATQSIPGYTGVRLRCLLEKRLALPVSVGNDVNCAAIGEAVFGAGQRISDFLCVVYGTGIGGAIVINHSLLTGSEGIAGEFGHMITHKDGKKCPCGRFGCYESYGSVKALEERINAVWPQPLSGKQIFKLRANEIVGKEIDLWIDEIVCGLTSLVYIFNPKCLILGGAVMCQNFVLHEIKKRLTMELIPSFADVCVKAAKLGRYSALYGAYYNALHL